MMAAMPVPRRAAAILALACAALLRAGAARAQQDQAGHTDPALGARYSFFRPKDADHGTWGAGGQVKMRLNEGYALQGSVDVTHHSAAGADYRVVPAQLTLLGYVTPKQPFSFYALLGSGWYFTRVGGPGAHSERPFRLHAGVGAEILAGGRWTVDGSFRFLWSSVWRFNDWDHPWGSGYHAQGTMVTVALNYLL